MDKETRILEVSGEGKLQVSPDIAIINIELTSIAPTAKEAIEKSKKSLSAIHQAVKKPKDLKTTSFNMDKYYETEKDPSGILKSVFKGFKINQHLQLVEDIKDQSYLEEVEKIQSSSPDVELSLNYSIKDSSKYKEKLIQLASKDATQTAKAIAKANDLKLVTIQHITLANFVTPYAAPRFNLMQARALSAVDSTPEDIHLALSLNVLFEIK